MLPFPFCCMLINLPCYVDQICLILSESESPDYESLLYPPHNEVVVGGGILASLRPSVRLSVHPSVRSWYTPLSWMILSKQKNLHLFSSQYICVLLQNVRPASRVRSVVLVGSISYLYILSGNFRRCVACKDPCKIATFEFLAIFLNL